MTKPPQKIFEFKLPDSKCCECNGEMLAVCFEDNVWAEQCNKCGNVNPVKFGWRFKEK